MQPLLFDVLSEQDCPVLSSHEQFRAMYRTAVSKAMDLLDEGHQREAQAVLSSAFCMDCDPKGWLKAMRGEQH
ncbi:MAG: hypothetical protein KGN37_17360 [Burkholderiales bacterium]|nr:hypothetical protein [Burkholderiales bacterium]MDE2434600.1 hypothetical protein [Burkholderiales bacterium]